MYIICNVAVCVLIVYLALLQYSYDDLVHIDGSFVDYVFMRSSTFTLDYFGNLCERVRYKHASKARVFSFDVCIALVSK